MDKHFIYWLTCNAVNFDAVLTKINKIDQKNLGVILENAQKWVNGENASVHQISINTESKIIAKVGDEFFRFYTR
ncbi:MAG: hypothetical protein LKM44_03385 [Wolbachia endosymbiont of Meromenopon meropis]|nr:hypothetical protein [Wolbachia endosymbiont of Meromenopon meropis]